jgi:membrane associated rhomboid family serine protease
VSIRSSFPQRTPDHGAMPPQPPAPITKLLVALNVAVFLLEEHWGSSTNQRTLERMGAIVGGSAEAVRSATLLSYGYLHIGAFHLGVNMFALWNLGRVLEPAMGKARFFVLYSVALLGAGLAITFVPSAITAGASGALYGLLGAVCMRMFARYRVTRVAEERREIRGNILRVLLPNLLISLLPGISLMGHVGGLVTGSLFVAVAWRKDERTPAAHPIMAMTAVVLALATVAAVAWVWLTKQPWGLS